MVCNIHSPDGVYLVTNSMGNDLKDEITLNDRGCVGFGTDQGIGKGVTFMIFI